MPNRRRLARTTRMAGARQHPPKKNSSVSQKMRPTKGSPRYELVDFAKIQPADCPCGSARRAFEETEDYPATIHRTEITVDAKRHYHRRLTEVYYILACDDDAQMELDDQIVPLSPGMAVLIRPGVRHRAVGKMSVLIVVTPKFDPADEFFD